MRLIIVVVGSILAWLHAGAATLTVPGQYASIQAAIDNAVAGDVVRVSPGTYAENLTLRTGIDVRGVEAARTFLDPAGDGPSVVINGISDVLFANFTLINATVGVAITDSTQITLASTVIDGASTAAIEVDAISGVDILNNALVNNQRAVLRGSIDVTVTNNILAGNVATVLTGTVALPILDEANIEFNCFFDNDDLAPAGIDAGLGTSFQIGNPDFVDATAQDFHLREGSPCIDAGTGTDVIDATVADMGAYGGEYADARPVPVAQPAASDASAGTPPPYAITLSWNPNESYLVTNTANAGRYRVYYDRDAAGPPYEGTDAGGGTKPSPIDVGSATSYTLTDLSPAAVAPAAPQLLSAAPANQSVTLRWQAVPGATGYRISYGVDDVGENERDVGAVTEASVTGLENGVSYRFAVAALAHPTYYLAVSVLDNTPDQNESVRSPESSIRIGEAQTSGLANELTAMPEEVVPFPNLSDEGGCFIAGAAFGAEWSPEVLALREFRDDYLLTSGAGRAFVRWYYANSPAAARFLNEHAGLKPLVRAALWPAVGTALIMNGSTPVEKISISLLAIAGLGLWQRRRLAASGRRT